MRALGGNKSLAGFVRLHERVWSYATPDERLYLPFIRDRIGHGSLAELVRGRFERERNLQPVLEDLALALETNTPWHG
jgi:hypothetical protein